MSSLRAALNISNNIINNWQDLKSSLLNAYGDRRDVYTLNIEITQLKQNQNENTFDFFQRIQKILNSQHSHIKTYYTRPEATFFQKFINNNALRVLLRGLRDPLGSLMRTKNPKTLNEALNMLTNDFQLETNNKPNHTQPNLQRTFQKPITQYIRQQHFENTNPRHNQNFNNQPFRQFNPQYQRTNQKRTFYNVTPNQQLPPNKNSNFYKPTPTSISTNNTYNPNPNNNRPAQLYNLQTNIYDNDDNQNYFNDYNDDIPNDNPQDPNEYTQSPEQSTPTSTSTDFLCEEASDEQNY